MQNFRVTNKEHCGMLWYFLEWSIASVITFTFSREIFVWLSLLFGKTLVTIFGYEMSKKRWAIAGGVIFVLVSVGVGLFVFFHERRAKSSGRWREYCRSDG